MIGRNNSSQGETLNMFIEAQGILRKQVRKHRSSLILPVGRGDKTKLGGRVSEIPGGK